MELISRRIMLAAGTAAGSLLTAASGAAEQSRNLIRSVLPLCHPEGLRTYASATFSGLQAAQLQMHTPPPFKRFRLTIILSTTMWNMHDGMDIPLL
jgi:hypothetical protein